MHAEYYPPIGAKPIRRTAQEEDEDGKLAVNNLVNGIYEDWPNEAGFDGLDEHRGPIQVPITGAIPSWAAGTLFRTGPGTIKIDNIATADGANNGTYHINHWFDGLAHTHRFDIVPEAAWRPDQQCGRAQVLYSSRRQSDALVQHLRRTGNKGSSSSGRNGGIITFAQRDDPCIGLFGKFMSSWAVAGNARATKKIENLAVTVQFAVPGFSPDKDVELNGGASNSGHRPASSVRPTVWLASDTDTMRQLDAQTLEPIGVARQVAVHPALTGPLSCAHAQRCPTTGDWLNVNLSVGPMPTYRIFRVSAATGKTDILATISKPNLKITYTHSFFLSERFLVLRLPSSTIGAYGLGILWKKNLLDAIEPFDESRICKWFVVDRLHGQGVVAEFETPAAFFFHTVNCFDELVDSAADDGQNGTETTQMADVYCDVVDYPTTEILYSMYYDVMLNREGKAKAIWDDEEKARRKMAKLVRWKLRVPVPCAPPLKEEKEHATREEKQPVPYGRAVLERLRRLAFTTTSSRMQTSKLSAPEIIHSIPAPHAGDLPTINPTFHTRPLRYVYSLANSGRSTLVDTLVKTDLFTREAIQWKNAAGHTPSEAIFVARPPSAGGSGAEDDGVLLSVVLDGFGGTSYLLCLDAETMRELGRAEMDFAVGIGFHGVHTTDRI
ncbi:unnamed protein product [Discula destructiva]